MTGYFEIIRFGSPCPIGLGDKIESPVENGRGGRIDFIGDAFVDSIETESNGPGPGFVMNTIKCIHLYEPLR